MERLTTSRPRVQQVASDGGQERLETRESEWKTVTRHNKKVSSSRIPEVAQPSPLSKTGGYGQQCRVLEENCTQATGQGKTKRSPTTILRENATEDVMEID